jgi:hypothetical protein
MGLRVGRSSVNMFSAQSYNRNQHKFLKFAFLASGFFSFAAEHFSQPLSIHGWAAADLPKIGKCVLTNGLQFDCSTSNRSIPDGKRQKSELLFEKQKKPPRNRKQFFGPMRFREEPFGLSKLIFDSPRKMLHGNAGNRCFVSFRILLQYLHPNLES